MIAHRHAGIAQIKHAAACVRFRFTLFFIKLRRQVEWAEANLTATTLHWVGQRTNHLSTPGDLTGAIPMTTKTGLTASPTSSGQQRSEGTTASIPCRSAIRRKSSI